MIYILNGEDITGKQFYYNNITYPSNWLDLSTDAEKNDLGIIKLEEVYPEIIESDKKYNSTYVDDYVNKLRIYNIVDKSPDDLETERLLHNELILSQIRILEQKQLEFVRDFLLGIDNNAKEKLQDLKKEIDVLNLQLK